MGLYDYTFYDLINRNAVAYANRDAWFEADDERSLSFLELKRQVDRLACGLQHSGIVKGDRLGVLALNSLEYFLLYGAAAALGAVVLLGLCYHLILTVARFRPRREVEHA